MQGVQGDGCDTHMMRIMKKRYGPQSAITQWTISKNENRDGLNTCEKYCRQGSIFCN